MVALTIGGFVTTPLFGEVSALQKYAHNAVLDVVIAAILFIRLRRHPKAVRSLQSS